VFLKDPRVPIDKNLAENSIRPFAVGRRNWLFFDRDRGAEASSAYYTLSATVIANDMEPMHYFRLLFNCIEHFGADVVPWKSFSRSPFSETTLIPLESPTAWVSGTFTVNAPSQRNWLRLEALLEAEVILPSSS
jgi:hypothetical protein